MSNISVDEIIDLTADAFTIPRDEIRGLAGKTHRITWERFSRVCAASLCRRHTDATWSAVISKLGMAKGGEQFYQMRGRIAYFEVECRKYPFLAKIVSEIEMEIDRIHDARMDEIEVYKTTLVQGDTSNSSCRLLTNH
jgi:hypothetical protein